MGYADTGSLPTAPTSIPGPVTGGADSGGWKQLAYQLGLMMGQNPGGAGAAGGLAPTQVGGMNGGVQVPQIQKPQGGGGGIEKLAGFAKLAAML